MVLALDRETINDTLHGGNLFLSDYFFEHVPLMQDPPEGAYRKIPYDPEEARKLIDEGFNAIDRMSAELDEELAELQSEK